MLAEHSRALQTDGSAAGIVIGAGRGVGRIVGIAVAGVEMTTDDIDAPGIRGIGTAQNGINVGDVRGLQDSRGRRLDELIDSHLKAIATLTGVCLEFVLNPFRGRSNPFVPDWR